MFKVYGKRLGELNRQFEITKWFESEKKKYKIHMIDSLYALC